MYINGMDVYGIVYKVKNKINNKHYIGITTQEGGFFTRYNYSGSPIERIYKYHKNAKKSGRPFNEFLLKDIEDYGFDNFEVDTMFDFAFSQNELFEKESKYIKKYNSLVDKEGYNKTTGGGRGKSSEYTKEKNRIASLGANNPRSERIICLNTGESFDCISDASEKMNIPRTSINSCCAGYNKRAGKLNGKYLVWRYEKEYNKLSKNKIKEIIESAQNEYTKKLGTNPRAIKVNIYYKGKFFGKEDSLLQASMKTGTHENNIGDMCKIGKHQVHTTGFSFAYTLEDDMQPFNYYSSLISRGRNVINIYKYGIFFDIAESLEEASKKTGLGNSTIKNIYLKYGKEKIHINSGYSFAYYEKDDKQNFDYLKNIRKQKNVTLINIYHYGNYVTFVLSAKQAEKITGIKSSRIKTTLLKKGKLFVDIDTGYSFNDFDTDDKKDFTYK